MAATLCHCGCHSGASILAFHGVDVTDPIEAATACDSCRDSHCPALLDHPEPPPVREMAVWVDPPIDQGDGAE